MKSNEDLKFPYLKVNKVNELINKQIILLKHKKFWKQKKSLEKSESFISSSYLNSSYQGRILIFALQNKVIHPLRIIEKRINTTLPVYSIFTLRGHPLSMYGTWENAQSCLQAEVSRLMCKYALTPSLFMFLEACFSYRVLYYLQKFNLTFIQVRCVRQKHFSLTRSVSAVMK